jgi:hypothetical protein
MNNSQQKPKTIEEALGDGKINFHSDLERLEFAVLLPLNFTIVDAKIIDNWDSQFGTRSFPIVKVRLEDDTEYTTILNGAVILKQVRKLLEKHQLPVSVAIDTINSGRGNSYYILCNPRVDVSEAAKS